VANLTETQAVGLFDAVLIEHALQGDKEAVRELARRYEAALADIDAWETGAAEYDEERTH
jgi:hypothetical protein